jgi:hypothetical protein
MSKDGSTRHSVSITSDGCNHRLAIDGRDVSASVRSATLSIEAGRRPHLIVEPVVDQVAAGAEALIVMYPRVAELLLQLGWTPPTEEPG